MLININKPMDEDLYRQLLSIYDPTPCYESVERLDRLSYIASLIINDYLREEKANINFYLTALLEVFSIENKTIYDIYKPVSKMFSDDEDEVIDDEDLKIIMELMYNTLERMLLYTKDFYNNKINKINYIEKMTELVSEFCDAVTSFLDEMNGIPRQGYNYRDIFSYELLYSPHYYGTVCYYLATIVTNILAQAQVRVGIEENILEGLYNNIDTLEDLSRQVLEDGVIVQEVWA